MKYLLALLLCASLAMVAPAAQAMAAPAYVPVTHEAADAPEPVVALLLELLLPGLGAIYLGEVGGGLLFMAVMGLVCILIALNISALYLSVLGCGIRILALVHVYNKAVKKRNEALSPHGEPQNQPGDENASTFGLPGPMPVSWSL